jgi:muramoyltetrapeptide carboxypeptidase LdcA involved in peptidoglycan recycling
MNKVPVLKKGSTIGIIAPSTTIEAAGEKTVRRLQEYLAQKGFPVIFGASCYEDARKEQSVEIRVADIHAFFKDPTIGCIMAFWGGETTQEILNLLDYDLMRKYPKILIGYSDITKLTLAVSKKAGFITFSGPAGISFGKPMPFHYTWDYFEKMCIAPQETLEIKSSSQFADDAYYLRPDNDRRILKHNRGLQMLRGGKAQGEILAGHFLSMLDLLGTPFAPTFEKKLLFIEFSEEESLTSINETLRRGEQAGVFKHIAGLVFGRFASKGNNASWNTLLKNYFGDASFPVLWNADFGHTDPLCTIPNGGSGTIDADTPSISFNRAVL